MPDKSGHGAGDKPLSTIRMPGDVRVFTLVEARALFPLVQHITAAAYQELNPIAAGLRAGVAQRSELEHLEQRYEAIIHRWVGKMERLGVVVTGLWLVDFDTGDGYLCWRYPEADLGHYHGYQQGFGQRRPVQEVIAQGHPSWAESPEP